MSDFLLRSEIFVPEMMSKIRYSNKILSLGSCFSVQIAEKLKKLQYQVLQNPAGITFNPISIKSTIKSIISSNSLPETSLQSANSLWSHPDFHSSFNRIDKNDVLSLINDSLNMANQFIRDVEFVFITVGTAFVFEQISNGHVVNNCHKLPSSHFNRKLLSKDEIAQSLLEVREMIDQHANNDVQYIFTLSPIRHLKDGIVDNQKSKSTCLLAIHDVVNQFDNCHYFPSYEIMLDDLRDYRFYKEDLIHPTDLALSYIYQKFAKFGLREEEAVIRKKVTVINKSLQHRPLNPDSSNHQKFMEKLEDDILDIQKKYSWMKF